MRAKITMSTPDWHTTGDSNALQGKASGAHAPALASSETCSSSTFIRATGLTKRFTPSTTLGHWLRGTFRLPDVLALQDVSFSVPCGLVGLAGPNGAGKSTLMRAIAGLITPDAGQLAVFDAPVSGSSRRFRQKVGYAVSGERSHFWRLSGVENIAFFGALHGYSRADALERSNELLELVGLSDEAHRSVREYSTGMLQRLSVARGLLGAPECLLLDEPTRGLDPGNAARLRQFVQGELVERRGMSILWATHDLEEMRSFCHTVIVLNHGRVAALGSFGEVLPKLGAVFDR